MAILTDVPVGMNAVIDGPAEVRVHGSSSESRFQIYDTGAVDLAPVIDYLAPSSAPLGPEPQPISVGGSNFASNAVIVFDGAPVATEFVSDTMLRASVSAGAAGAFDVLVRDGSIDSNVEMFTFTDPAEE